MQPCRSVVYPRHLQPQQNGHRMPMAKKKSHERIAAIGTGNVSPAKPGYKALRRETTLEERRELFQSLKNYGKFTGLYWRLMSPEPQIQATPLPVATIDDIIFSEEFLQLQGPEAQRQHLLERATLDWETIQQVSHFTAGQRDNPSWQMIRKSRLTASNFGSILNAKRVTPSLIKRLLGEYDLTRVKAVQWGITNEPEALNSFIQKTAYR